MPPETARSKTSAFDGDLTGTLAALIERVQALYKSDDAPWIIGYSGGKDSTATAQLVWTALAQLPEKERSKTVHLISTDTLVENPIVSAWVRRSLESMRVAALEQGLPIEAHLLTPEVSETFWVNLIGKGYPAPNTNFRWCTDRMKIRPSNSFVRRITRQAGESIVVLGTRRAESSGRASRMKKLAEQQIRDGLSPSTTMPNSYVYSPIEDWTNDDVWVYLMQVDNPWGYDNKDLMTMYRGASADAECPLVVDTTTPSCGNSRFGCWTCTLVDEDKSMGAMIQNDAKKDWMQPLLDIRNELADSKSLRDFRRMSGKVSLFNNEAVRGPYTQDARAHWLTRVLEAQTWVRKNGPEDVRDLELITMEELHEIRRVWLVEKGEWEDRLPAIFEEATGEPFPAARFDDRFPFGATELDLLKVVASDDLHYELIRSLLVVSQEHRSKVRRAGIHDDLIAAFDKSGFASAEEAVEFQRQRVKALGAIEEDVEGAPAGLAQGER